MTCIQTGFTALALTSVFGLSAIVAPIAASADERGNHDAAIVLGAAALGLLLSNQGHHDNYRYDHDDYYRRNDAYYNRDYRYRDNDDYRVRDRRDRDDHAYDRSDRSDRRHNGGSNRRNDTGSSWGGNGGSYRGNGGSANSSRNHGSQGGWSGSGNSSRHGSR
jgi:hypothetical protein